MTKSQQERHTQRLLSAHSTEEKLAAEQEATLALLECSEHVGTRVKSIQEDVAYIRSKIDAREAYESGLSTGRTQGAHWAVQALKIAGTLSAGGGLGAAICKVFGS